MSSSVLINRNKEFWRGDAHEKGKLISSLGIVSFLAGAAINLPLASAQTNDDDYQKQLYDNKELFEQLSGAAQSVLEQKFGQVVTPASGPAPGGTAAESF